MKYFGFLLIITIAFSSIVYAVTDFFGDCKKLVDKKQRNVAITQCYQAVTYLQVLPTSKGGNKSQLLAKLKYADSLGLQFKANQSFKMPRSGTGTASGLALPVGYISGSKLIKLLEQQYLLYYDIYSTAPLDFPTLYDQSLIIKSQLKKIPVDFNQDMILHQYVSKIHRQGSDMNQCDSGSLLLLEQAKSIYQYFANKGRSVDDSNPYYDILSEIRQRQNGLLNCKGPYIKTISKPITTKLPLKPAILVKPIVLDAKPKIINLDIRAR